MKQVSIKFTSGSYESFISTHRTESDETAIERAFKKHFGKSAVPCMTRSSGSNYVSQVGFKCKSGGYSLKEGQIYIEIKNI